MKFANQMSKLEVFCGCLITFILPCFHISHHKWNSKQQIFAKTNTFFLTLKEKDDLTNPANVCFVSLFFQQAIVEKRCCIVAFMNGITKKILKILRTMRHYYFKTEFWNTDFQTGWYISLEFSIIGVLKTFRASHSCKILSTLMTFLARRFENTCIIFCTRSSPKLARFFSGYVNISTNLAYLSNTGVDF